MANELYEIRPLRSGQPIRGVEPFTAMLDRHRTEEMNDLLNRHLAAVVYRCEADPSDAHLFSLEVRDTDRNQRGFGQPVIRWTFPVGRLEVR